MAKERAIDLQLIKPVTPGSPGSKGKITLKNLLKQYFKDLNIPFADLCCEAGLQNNGGYPVRFFENQLQQLNSDGEWITIELGDFLFSVVYDDTNTVTLTGEGNILSPLQVNVRISDDARSTSLFGSNTTGIFLNSPKLRDAQRPAEFPMLELPRGVLKDSLDSAITMNGAMSTATITADGGYDRVTVGAGDINSYFTIGRQVSMSNMRTKVRIKINSIGTTPIVGIRGIWPGLTYSNFNNTQPYGYINLATRTWNIQNEGTVNSYNGTISTVATGDIIEIVQDINHLRGITYTFNKLNNYMGEVSISNTVKAVNQDGTTKHSYPVIILADGDYTILDVSVYFLDAQRPKILTIGDSVAVGLRCLESESITAYFKSNQPYEAGNIGSGSVLTKGMLATIWQVLKIKPEYAVILNYLDPLSENKANPASPSYAIWAADFRKYVSILKSFGIKPVLIYPESWDGIATPAECLFYETFLNTEFPTDIKIKILTSESFFDSTGFIYNGVSNQIIANKVIAELLAGGAL